MDNGTKWVLAGLAMLAFAPVLSNSYSRRNPINLMDASLTKAEKFALLSEYAKEAQRGTGLFVSVTLAQWALETGYGKSTIGNANNLFGVKSGSSWTGKVISMSTNEVVGGRTVRYTGTGKTYANRAAAIADKASSETLFRSYNSPVDSIKDRVRLLLSTRYTRAGVNTATTPEQQAERIKAAGYATDPLYPSKLTNIIRTFNLKQYD